MALAGVRVVELAGLAPAPFCGMILADFGASVIRVDRLRSGGVADTLGRGKRSLAVDLKTAEGVAVLRRLCLRSDVLLEPYRKGVMEKLGLGPQELLQKNPRLVYARLTGYGQSGPLAANAGHDINFLAVSGVLSRLGRRGDKPTPPLNLLADFAGGGLTCALGVVLALLERSRSGRGQVIDASMVEGAAYAASFVWKSARVGLWDGERGQNLLDGGAPFYDVYETKDGRHVAVGAIEPQFYAELLKGLDLDPASLPPQMSVSDWPELRRVFTRRFASRTLADWTRIFSCGDACVTPVLTFDQAASHPHSRHRGSFISDAAGDQSPRPAPVLSRTPAQPGRGADPEPGRNSEEVLLEIGYDRTEIQRMLEAGVVGTNGTRSRL